MEGSHSVTEIVAHVVWSTASRERVLDPSRDEWLMRHVEIAAAKRDARVIALGAAWDHVHCLMLWPPTVALAEVLQRIKGSTARLWNVDRDVTTKLVWQAGYWARSVDPTDLGAIARYVANQRRHHATPQPPEDWELARFGTP
ncbi:MAG: IS200/IS605 family transposase [Polyangiales bacterium]